MIKSVEKNDEGFVGFCKRDVFGTRISCLYSCYSTDYDFVRFWVQTDENGQILSAVSRLDGDVTISSVGTGADELRDFLNFAGFRTIQCEKSIARLLSFKPSVEGYVVEYVGNGKKFADFNTDNSFRSKEIYDIIKSAKLVGVGDYLPWLSDMTFRMNRGAAYCETVISGGKAVACAMKLFVTDSAVLLGAVATKPEYRGRGYAGALVTHLAESENGKRVELLCKNDSIVDFYKSIGFDVKNEWSIIDEQ